jgi:hypothetical protein
MLEIIIGRAPSGQRFLVRRFLLLLFIVAAIGVAVVVGQQAGSDWTQFGWDLASSGTSTNPTGITAVNVASLSRRQVHLDGTVDSSAIYLHGVTVKGSSHDVLFMTTTYGKTIAVDANQGTALFLRV